MGEAVDHLVREYDLLSGIEVPYLPAMRGRTVRSTVNLSIRMATICEVHTS